MTFFFLPLLMIVYLEISTEKKEEKRSCMHVF